MFKSDVNAVITFDGKVFYYIPVIVKSFCEVGANIKHNDTVVCSLKFMSWSYDGGNLDLSVSPYINGVDLSIYERAFNKNWKVMSSASKRNAIKYDCCPEKYIDVTYTLQLLYNEL